MHNLHDQFRRPEDMAKSRKRRLASVAFLAAAMLGIGFPLHAGPLKDVVAVVEGTGVRIDISATGSGRGTAFALDGPKRLVIDLPGVSAGTLAFAGGGPVAGVRTAQFDAATARVVLDLAAPVRITASTAAAGRLSLVVAPASEAEFAGIVAAGRTPLAQPQPKVQAQVKPQPQALPPGATVTLARAEPVRAATSPRPPAARPHPRSGLPVVVIDPGHGGKDVGTISVLGGKYEKDVVLGIALAIKKELDASGRVRAILTRGDDRYLRHRDRFELARRNRADLFISVHADSAPVPTASGATVYTLSETASDAEAARLATKENRSDIIAGVDLGIETSEVSDILIDLAQRETMNTSAQFAAILQRELRQDIKVRSQFHRFAGFLVLKAPDVPSVLLETGYLSNSDDSKFLVSQAGQMRIARGVRRAVEEHFMRRLAQR